MKTYKSIIVLLTGCLLFIISCGKTEEVHQEYIPDGEIIYKAKPMNVVGYSGKNRMLLTWQLIHPTLVTKCEIREGTKVWAEIPVEYKDTVNMEYTLSGLDEKTYTISLYSLDVYGNSSIKSDVIVDVYGERYSSTLKTTRSLKSVLRKSDRREEAVVTLSEKTSSKIYGTDIFYKSVTGNEEHVRLLEDEYRVEIENVADDSYFIIQDIYQPVPTCIDLFPAMVKEYAVADIPAFGARTFSRTYWKDNTTVVGTLTTAATGTVKTVVKYSGNEVSVDPGTTDVVLENVPSDAIISMETILVVEEVEYLTSVINIDVNSLYKKIDMSEWEVIDFSSQQDSEGKAEAAIDDNLSTFWHTQYSPSLPDYPHFMTVDMKETATVKAIAVARRTGNNNIAARMRLEISVDGTNWTIAGEFSPNNSINGLQIFEIAPATGRYFRLTGLSSSTSNAYMCMSEMNLYE